MFPYGCDHFGECMADRLKHFQTGIWLGRRKRFMSDNTI